MRAEAQKATVFVVDDNRDFRDSLRWLLESVRLNVETYDSAERFLEECPADRPGCLVLDIRMPGMGGLGLLERLRNERRRVPVIVVTGHGDVPIAVRAMQAGALDFIQKPFNDQDLLDRIHRALEHAAALQQQNFLQQRITNRYDRLTTREKEVLERLLQGESNKIISAELKISHRTVETHRKKIMQKMQANSLPELVHMVLQIRDHP